MNGNIFRTLAGSFFFISLVGCSTDKPLCEEEQENQEEQVEPEEQPAEPIEDSFVAHKPAALLDTNLRNQQQEDNNEHGRNAYSAAYMLEVSGLPFINTHDLQHALDNSNVLLLSSPLKAETFSEEELAKITGWIKEGGILIAPAIMETTPAINHIFGISSVSFSKQRERFQWNQKEGDRQRELMYFDEEEEQTVSLGNLSKAGMSIKTYGYTLTSGEPLAYFDDHTAAVVRHAIGKGFAYSAGLLWRDVIQRPQLNKDFSASRKYSHFFETSSDAFALLLRSIHLKNNDISVWKHTIPQKYSSVLIPTHDCDSRTSYDEMHLMSEYEKQEGIKGHYFLTVHYFRDEGYLSSFYDEHAISECKKALDNGHTVGSHSIGHFPDFNITERFPVVVVDKDNYRPHHDLNTHTTTGGSTWAEIALSKQIIEHDLANKVRSFRSGHLCVNKNFPVVTRDAGYEFSSCFNANEVLTTFPFLERTDYSWSGNLSTVLQIPLHISDVFANNPMKEHNWMEKVNVWASLLKKYSNNFSPVVLLIHPNRDWKMYAEKELVNRMDRTDIGIYNFEAYGDFWNNRRRLDFEYCYIADKGRLLIKANHVELLKKGISFAIEKHDMEELKDVFLLTDEQQGVKMKLRAINAKMYKAYLE